MSNGLLVFIKDEFVSIFGGDEELVQEVLAGFLIHCDELTASMADAARRGDRESLVFSAHKLKGSSANVRAPGLSEAAAEFERWLKGDQTERPSQKLGNVIDRYLEFKREILALYPEMSGRLCAPPKAAAGGGVNG